MLVKTGDKVEFILLNSEKVFGDVLYMPQATGDCWIVQTYHKGEKDCIAYIQNFSVMYVQPK